MSTERLWQLARFLGVILAIFFIGWLIIRLSSFMYPFVFAFLLALFSRPLVDFFQKRLRINRGWGALLSIILISSLLIGSLVLIIMQLIRGLVFVANQLPAQIQELSLYFQKLYNEKLAPIWNDASEALRSLEPSQQNTVQNSIQSLGSSLASAIGEGSKNMAGMLQTILATLPSIALILVIVLLAWFFIAKDWHRYEIRLKQYEMLPWFARAESVVTSLRSALFGYIKAQLTLITITFFIVLVGLLIIGVEHPFAIAFIAAFFDILPYLGTGSVFLPWIAYSIVTGDTGLAIGLGILYALVILQRNIMEPKIVGDNIGIQPITALIALFVGIQFFGVFGLILGPLVAVIIKALHNAQIFHYLWSFIKGSPTPFR
ncbi:sporulation integral membrane protein YtvI [Exiguobacterium sp. RIT452]|jgi:sporulation integral membrane protein YtvI|uniref:sporulation integral membrane protein YtvI n=1 Tax=Exiguobacterium TaxID=33986 RepID=UPI00047D1D54|nr:MULTISPECIES: sporulation integral membrane protein YtvI [Exiguobacterium]RJP00843.1 sporulation integral membrane protein YtvI [Exiguobacterium sp. RIT452]